MTEKVKIVLHEVKSSSALADAFRLPPFDVVARKLNKNNL